MATRAGVTPQLLLLAVCLQAGACSSIYLDAPAPASPPPAPAPGDCRTPAKLFAWFSIRAKTIAWTKGKDASDPGTLTLEFTITDEDRLPRALSNSGTGFLYDLEYSLNGEDGNSFRPTESSGMLAGSEVHAPLNYESSKDGGLKFKIQQGNYSVVLTRKFNGKPLQSFACTLTAQ